MKALTRDGRGLTFGALFVGYAGYYVCRSVLSVGTPLILDEFAGVGVTKATIGWVASAGTIAYMVGKVVNGVLADRFGGRALFVGGMVASAVCTALFGVVGVALFAVVWSANRFFQSAGWGALVQVVSRRFPVASHATVMGLLSMSFLLGDAVSRLYLGGFIGLGFGWRGLFGIAALTLLAIAAVCALALSREPEGEPPATLAAQFPGVEAQRGVVARLVRSPAFWIVCLLSGGMTLLRDTFNTWSPTILTESAGMSNEDAALGSALLPVAGALSAALAGFASDRWRGRRGPVIFVALAGLTAVMATLAVAPLAGNAPLAIGLLMGGSFLLTGPYSFCAGVLALDLGGKRGAATAAGLIDAAGYLCAIASGVGVGTLAQRSGWPAVFLALAAVAAATAAAGLGYAFLIEKPHREESA